jgi:ATP-dependent RNA helicase DeaD
VEDEAPSGTGGFAELGLRPELLGALTALGYEEPTPIQREAIPPLLGGRDLVGQAATGTGKTAAFALPLLQSLSGDRRQGPSGLVLVPTRELAVQVSEALHRYGKEIGARTVPLYGGQPIGRQLRALDQGADIIVATPGRALDHLQRGTLRLEGVATVVLDEADEMLDMGFAEDLEALLEATPHGRQTVLFSATLPARIDAIAERHQHDPVRIRIREDVTGGGGQVREVAYIVHRSYKPAALGRILDVESPTAALVFCRTRSEVDQLTETLNGRGYRAEALHGGMGQEQRDRVMGRLRAGTADLIVATDVAARGLDVEGLTHVVNYDVPSSVESYVHRTGRVGRAGRAGTALTLAEPREDRMLRTIRRVTGRRITTAKVPSVEDLRARRLELLEGSLREVIESDELEHLRVVVEALASEFDVMDVALAAVKLAADERGGEGGHEEDIPEPTPPAEQGRTARDGNGRRAPGRPGEAPDGRRPKRGTTSGMTRLWVGAGREAGMRPQDLVGAVTGESHLTGRQIGAIDIAPRFSLVEVPDADADAVVAAMRGATIRGKRVTFRRDRGGFQR